MLRNGGKAGAQKAQLARTFKAILTFTPAEKSQTVRRLVSSDKSFRQLSRGLAPGTGGK